MSPVLGHYLSFEDVHSGVKEPYVGWGMALIVLSFGLLWIVMGLWHLARGFDRRPVVVVDSEGLFYRPYGASIIPWRDIRNVEWIETHGAMGAGKSDNVSYHILVTTRDSPHLLVIKIDHLPGRPIYTAISQAWKRHGGAA